MTGSVMGCRPATALDVTVVQDQISGTRRAIAIAFTIILRNAIIGIRIGASS